MHIMSLICKRFDIAMKYAALLYVSNFVMYIIVLSTVLQIRFERSSYTYLEPQGFDPLAVKDIYMVKNINTELTYRIFLQIIAEGTTPNLDYFTALNPSDVIYFFPNQQRLQVFENVLFFEILPDGLPESVETVEISSDPVNNPGPAYTRPQTGAVTTIFIVDNDSKNTYNYYNYHYLSCLC